MFGHDVRYPVVLSIDYDPAADESIPVWQAPRKCEVVDARVTVVNDVAGATDNWFDVALLNGGSAGTATTELAGTTGGTGGWTGLTPKTMSITEGTLEADDVVVLKYNEEGTGTFTQMTLQMEVVYGVAG